MRHLVFITLLGVLTSSALAQNWTKRYNSSGTALDEAKVILPASAGASIVVGSSFASQSGWNVTALQYDANGNLLWINPFSYNSSSNSDDKATCAVRDQSGNIYIGGFSWSDSTGWDFLLIKLDQNGQQQWSKRINSESFHNDIATAIALDAQGNIYLTGRSTSSSDVMNILTMKYDPSGNQQWSKRYNAQSTSDEEPMSIAVDASNNIVVAGEHAGSTRDILVIKYNSSGVEQWAKTFNRTSTGDDEAHAMTIDAQSNIILVGASMPMGGMHDALIMKIKPDGSSAWTKTYNGTGNESDHAFAVQTDAAGNVFVSTKSKGTSTGDDIATIKYKADGTEEWVSRYDGGAAAADNAAPRFAGVTAGRATTSTDALVTWAPASDDQTEEDDIVYLLFVATSSGGQNFSSPTKVITGDNTGVIGNLLADKDYFVVVRARDEAGNTDKNIREVKIHTPIVTLIITTNNLPDGEAGKDYPPITLQVANGTPPYSWSVVSGDIPTPNFAKNDGVLSGFLSIPGLYTLDFLVTDSQNRTATKRLPLNVIPPPNYTSTNGATFTAGKYWFNDFIIKSGHTVNTNGPVTFCITGKLTIEQNGNLISPNCDTLGLDLLSKTQLPEILGDVRNNCPSQNKQGADLVIRTVYNLQLGSRSPGSIRSHIQSSGQVFIGDPWYVPRSTGDTIRYANTGAKNFKASPVCAIKGNPLMIGATYPQTVSFDVIHKDPDGGLTSITLIDYGDTTITNPTLPFTHQYNHPGLYRVRVNVRDDENDTSAAMMTLNLRPPLTDTLREGKAVASIWAAPVSFVADSLIKPIGIPFGFTSGKDTTNASLQWDLGEDFNPTLSTVYSSFDDAGNIVVVLRAKSGEGFISTAMMNIYAPLEGGSTVQYDPPITQRPFPPLPPAYIQAAPPAIGDRTFDNGNQCNDCTVCTNPFSSPGPVVSMGATTITSGHLDSTAWSLGPFITGFGFTRATVVVDSSFLFAGFNGRNGTAAHPNARMGYGIHIGTLSGRLVMCGGNFALANGGNGAPANDPSGCGAFAKGGHGGRSSPIWLSSPNGRISFCGRINVQLASGGVGGSASAYGTIQANDCTDGCNADAIGGKGAYGGGGIFYSANEICYDANYSVSFSGGTVWGGDGGGATARASNGTPCTDCDKRGGHGGDAYARGGKGGGCSWYFITKFYPPDSVFRNHFDIGASFDGGWGGPASAFGGNGGAATCDDCTGKRARGGNGGDADAYGGDGGYGENPGVGGDVDAWAGDGGSATMTPKPPKEANGCPGKPGCDTKAIGGKGGDANAVEGVGRGGNGIVFFEWDGNGGDASATGGDGGDGVGCPKCDGGRGGKATSIAGEYGGEGDGGAIAGNATANGGKGGNGSTCCTPPLRGGNGARGGDAIADAGDFGVAAGKGGDGGNGGDGCPAGKKGFKGKGIGKPNNIPDGADGKDGVDCCPIIKCNFVLDLAQLGVGIITPGSDRTISTANGPVKIHFASAQEILQTTGFIFTPIYRTALQPNGTTILEVQQGWIEIWQDQLTCDAKKDTTQIDVINAPVYSSSFNASGGALYHADPAQNNGPHTFVLNSGTEPRIGYQVMWTTGRFFLIVEIIN